MNELVPFLQIPYGSKIVIYGGGKLGQHYYRKIELSRRIEVVAVVDTRIDCLPRIFGDTPLCEPDKINEIYFDYILIAVENIKSAEEIKQHLYKYKVEERKIIWNDSQLSVDRKSVSEIVKWIERNVESENRRFFLFMLPEHGNLGDYAIGYAELDFLKHYFCQYDVYGVTTSEWSEAGEFYLNMIKPQDVIFINGGGFLGDLWDISDTYKCIIESFPQNIKIFFPNTLTYKENPDDKNMSFMEDVEWFGKQNNLYTFFRENISYQLFRQYEKRCYLFPDMVFYLNYERNEYRKKNKVLLCLRNDCEKTFSGTSKLKKILEGTDMDYDIYDIYMGKYISQQAGHRLLKYTVKLFQSYDCIITDRLHGMILAIVSNVPCVAFDNRTHKIGSVFESIKELQYVKLITEDEIGNIDKLIKILYETKLEAGAYKSPTMEFEQMAGKICEIMDSAK